MNKVSPSAADALAIFTAIGKYIRQIFHPFTEHANSTQSHLKGNRRDATNSLGAVLTLQGRLQIVLTWNNSCVPLDVPRDGPRLNPAARVTRY